MEIEYTPLSISEIDKIKETSSLYALNGLSTEGEIIFECVSGGKSVAVLVKSTWIPQDLSSYAKRSDIIDSADFRRLVSRGTINIISENDYKSIMSGGDAQNEHHRIFKDKFEKQKVTLSVGDKAKVVNTTANPRIISLIARSNGNELSASEAIVAIKATKGLTKDDLKYVLDKSTDAQIKKYAATELDKS
jgi:hypothetical protein